MIKKWHKNVALLSIGLTIFCTTSSCIITFINDSNGKTFIRDRSSETIYPLEKNNRRRLGEPHKLADFEICVQDGKANVFKPLYVCTQKTCSKNGNPQIKFSDIEHGRGQAELFIIQKKTLPVSMVRRLPMIMGKRVTE